MKATLIIIYLLASFGLSAVYEPIDNNTLLITSLLVVIGCLLIDIKKELKNGR